MNRSALLTVFVAFSFLGAACDGPEAPPPASYDACVEDADCVVEGDTCIPLVDTDGEEIGRECTRECAADADCPSAGRCFSVGVEAATCHQACGAGTDCRDGWGCQAQADGRGICLPGPSTPTGLAALQTCPLSTFPSACGAELECFALDPSGPAVGICTRTCSDPRPCDAGSCITFNEIDFTCLQTCTVGSAECPEGLTCKDTFDDGTVITPVCLPTTPPADD